MLYLLHQEIQGKDNLMETTPRKTREDLNDWFAIVDRILGPEPAAPQDIVRSLEINERHNTRIESGEVQQAQRERILTALDKVREHNLNQVSTNRKGSNFKCPWCSTRGTFGGIKRHAGNAHAAQVREAGYNWWQTAGLAVPFERPHRSYRRWY